MTLLVSAEPITWHQPISEARARDILRESFDQAVARGVCYCQSRAAGMWDANEREYFQAYETAARVAAGKP